MDDFIGLAASVPAAHESFLKFRALLADIGIPDSPDKRVPPTSATDALGFLFDCRAMTVAIRPDTKIELSAALNAWLLRSSCFLNELQKLVGWLLWNAQVLAHGRTFLTACISKLRPSTQGGTRRHINAAMRAEFRWWLRAIALWPGLDLTADLYWRSPVVQPFTTDSTLLAGGKNFISFVVLFSMSQSIGGLIGTLGGSRNSYAAGQVVDAVKQRRVDLAFVAIDPVRGADIDYTPPYVIIEGAYLVRDASPLQANGEVDREIGRAHV